MPQIIVTADRSTEDGTAHVMLRERVTEQDFESGHFAAQLLERIEWAVGDVHEAERRSARQPAHRNRSTVRDAHVESRPRPVAVPSA
jgi:hypothetical protein